MVTLNTKGMTASLDGDGIRFALTVNDPILQAGLGIGLAIGIGQKQE